MAATPRPWAVDETNPRLIAKMVDGVHEYIANFAPDDFSTTERSDAEIRDNAALAVRAVNAHDELVEAARLKRNTLIDDDRGFKGRWVAVPEEDFDRLHAALAKAKK